MNTPDDDVFLLDCGNTPLDDDRVPDGLRTHFASEFGPASRDRYWEIFEALRAEPDDTNILGASRRHRRGALDPHHFSAYPPTDLAIEGCIGDRPTYDFPALLKPARAINGEQETT